MQSYGRLLLIIVLLLICISVQAQEDAVATKTRVHRVTSPQSSDSPSQLKSGDNEFGFWGGFSPAATTVFGGLHDDEASDRRFFIGALRYGRTLVANDHLALQYTLDAIPVAVATGVIVSRSTVGGVTTFRRETAY